VKETAAIMEDQGCVADWHEGDDGDFYIDEYTCPFPKIAETDRAVCALHVEFVRTLTGSDTRLTRSLMRGERACTYRVKAVNIAAEDIVPVR
jgi:predicted ArsR family transcriptional regulator